MVRSRYTRARATAIIIVECSMMVAFAIHIPITPIESLQASIPRQAIPSQLRAATMPNSSDPSGDEWPMYQGNLNHTGATTSKPARASNLKWTFTTNKSIYSSPIISNGRVYVGCNDKLFYCLNATTGAKIWSYPTSYAVSESAAIAMGYVYVVDYYLYCLNATTGAFVWVRGTNFATAPAVSEGRVYVGNRSIICLNATNGDNIWSYTTGNVVNSCPAIANRRVYIGSQDRYIYCLNAATGGLIWKNYTGNNIISTPVVMEGRVFITSNSTLYCFDAFIGTILWRTPYYYYVNDRVSPAILNNVVYFLKDYYICRASTTTGSMETGIYIATSYISSFAIAGDNLYVVCGDNGQSILCINPHSFERTWSYQIATDSWSHTAAPSPAIVNGYVYISSMYCGLYCFPMLMIASAPKSVKAIGNVGTINLTWQAP